MILLGDGDEQDLVLVSLRILLHKQVIDILYHLGFHVFYAVV